MISDNTKIQEKFDGNCLKQDKISFDHKNVIKLYIVYDIMCGHIIQALIEIRKFVISVISLTKNTDPNKRSYSGYGIGFDSRVSFSLSGVCGSGKNIDI